MEGVGAEIGAVHLVLGQPAELLGDELVGDGHGLVQGLALGHLADHAGDGDGRAAAEGLELDVGQPVVLDLDVERHHVAADGIADLADAVGVGQDADVAGIGEMVHDFVAVHHEPLSLRYSV